MERCEIILMESSLLLLSAIKVTVLANIQKVQKGNK